MKQYHIKKDGFDIGQAKGKQNAVIWLTKYLSFEGIPHPKWGQWKLGALIVKTAFNEFTISE